MRLRELGGQSLRRSGQWGLYLICAPILLFLISPIFVVYPLAFSSSSIWIWPPPGYSLYWVLDFFSDPKWTDAVLMSVKVSTVAMALATLLGTAASFTLVRVKFRGKDLILSLVLMPQILPFIILAIALYFLFAPLHLIGNWTIVALGQSVLAIPLVVVIVSAALKGFDRALENAAMSLGAPPLTAYLKVTFPMIRPGLLTAALFAFMTSFDELLLAMFLGGERAATIPKRMWEGLRYEMDPRVSVVAMLLTTFSILMLILIQSTRRGKNQGGR